ncbi:hypothetical protein FHX74_002556 [Friedmanniella endophytica]|uniref:Helix-turn-helix domain-containing protein n=1 Tax=Microlunatus kandeliicorticis TaxID=1759536 RepID=A0A7W3ITI6_9ACTN|nr:hypothetical protein [Microlunatus kandeliicorticis]MBA8794928.1 hypothetical protein [Microlunatus kandeliicorticis]
MIKVEQALLISAREAPLLRYWLSFAKDPLWTVNGMADDRYEKLMAALKAISPNGTAEVPPPPDPVDSVVRDRIGSAHAARLVGVSERQVRNLADQLGGRKVGRSWTFDLAAVEALVIDRQDRQEGRG